jgi:hypothetical protein
MSLSSSFISIEDEANGRGELCFAAAHGKEARPGSLGKSFEPLKAAGSNTA